MVHGLWRHVFILSSALLVTLSASTAQARQSGVLVPVETPNTKADWQLDREGGTLHRVVDEQLDRAVLEYREKNPLSGASFYVDVDKKKLAGTDTLRFKWRVVGDPARVMVEMQGHPDYPGSPGDEGKVSTTHVKNEGRRRYYLHKRPNPVGQWQEVFLDLRHDDDGGGRVEAPDDKTRLVFGVRMRSLEALGPEPVMAVRLADIRFESHPLRIEADLAEVETIENNREIGQRYYLKVTNKTDRPQVVKLWTDPSGLRDFQVELGAEQFELAGGETKVVPAEITVPAARGRKLPPLTMESEGVFAATAEQPDWTTTWYTGYLVYELIGATPAAPSDKGPWLADARRRQRIQQRYQAGDEAARHLIDRTVMAAEEALKIDPTPPGEDCLHGNPNWKVDKRWNAPLAFQGPGKWYLKTEDRLLSRAEIAAASERVRRSLGYSHHRWLAASAETLARAWWYTEREEFARKAGEILLAYAERYRDWPRNEPSSLGYFSKVGSGILQESWWGRHLPETFDLVRASGVLSDEQQQKIVDGLLIPVAATIRSHRIEANQQAEINAAYGLCGLVSGRWDLAADALAGEGGIRSQWYHDFDADGFTSERDMAYHFAAMDGMVQLADGLESVGVEVYDQDFKRLFDAPVAYSTDQLPGRYEMYVAAYEHYRDPSYLPQVRVALRRMGSESAGTELTPQQLDRAGRDAFTNSVLENSGYTVLRSGTSPADLIAIKMNWGSPSKRHGASMFDTQVSWRGAELTQYTGRVGYGYQQSGFAYTVASGNTLILDGRRQTMIRTEQTAILGGKLPAARWESREPRPLYPGVSWARTAAIAGDTAIVIDQVDSNQPHRCDWLCYLPGKVQSVSAGGGDPQWKPYPQLAEQGNGYSYLQDPVIAPGDANLPAVVKYQAGGKATGLLTVLGSGGQLLQAAGWATWHPKKAPLILARDDRAKTAWFVAAYTGQTSPDAPAPHVQRLDVTVNGKPVPPAQALAVKVTDASGSHLVLTAADNAAYQVDGHKVRGPLTVAAVK